jgi:hypothetical protein
VIYGPLATISTLDVLEFVPEEALRGDGYIILRLSGYLTP